MPTYFHESVEQSSSPEVSDELIMAVAAGRWWAIMEVSKPISEENAYGDPTSWQWCGTVEEGENSCTTSLFFSDSSENVQSPGFSDATLKSTKQRRQKQRVPVVAVSEKVKERDLTSSPVFSDASEKTPHSGFSDAKLKQWSEKMTQGAPAPYNIPEKKKLNISKPLRQPLASSLKGARLCCTQDAQGVPDKIPGIKTQKIPELLKKEQQNPQASSLQVALMSTKSPLDAPLPNSSPMGAAVHIKMQQCQPGLHRQQQCWPSQQHCTPRKY